MSNYISINVQEVNPTQSVHHSARSKTVTYLVAEPNTITTYRHDLQDINIDKSNLDNVRTYFELRHHEINADYKEHNNNRNVRKGTKLYQEAVIGFGREQFENNTQPAMLNSIDNFCNSFEQKYGCKVLMSSLHLDEGHKDDAGNVLHNYHAHVLIENYNFDTHKTCLQNLDYRQLQTEVAKEFETLGFERGDPERKAQRLEHREYREMKEREAALAKEIKQFLEPLNPTLERLNEQYEIESAAQLGMALAKEINNSVCTPGASVCMHAGIHANMQDTRKNQIIADFKTQLDQKTLEMEQIKELYKQTRDELKATKEAKQADYQQLKKMFDEQKTELETRNAELTRTQKQILDLQVKLETVESERDTLHAEITASKGKEAASYLEIRTRIESDAQKRCEHLYKPTFNRGEVDHAKQIALAVDMHNKRLNPLKSMYNWEVDGKTMTPGEFKKEHEALIESRILAIDGLEHKVREIESQRLAENTELTKVIADTSKQLEQQAKLNQELVQYQGKYWDETKKYWNERAENQKLERGIGTLKAIQGKEPQELQTQIISQIEEIRTLKSEKSSLEYGKSSQEKKINDLAKENMELEAENKTLKNAIERFLELPTIKGITNTAKAIIERFNDGLEGIKTLFTNQENQNQQLIKKLTIVNAELSHFKTKQQEQLLKTDPRDLKTNVEVVDYFRKLMPDLIAKLVQEEKNPSGGYSSLLVEGKSCHYYKPEKLAELLASHCKVALPERQQQPEIHKSTDFGISR
jgi:hypothetical protein